MPASGALLGVFIVPNLMRVLGCEPGELRWYDPAPADMTTGDED